MRPPAKPVSAPAHGRWESSCFFFLAPFFFNGAQPRHATHAEHRNARRSGAGNRRASCRCVARSAAAVARGAAPKATPFVYRKRFFSILKHSPSHSRCVHSRLLRCVHSRLPPPSLRLLRRLHYLLLPPPSSSSWLLSNRPSRLLRLSSLLFSSRRRSFPWPPCPLPHSHHVNGRQRLLPPPSSSSWLLSNRPSHSPHSPAASLFSALFSSRRQSS